MVADLAALQEATIGQRRVIRRGGCEVPFLVGGVETITVPRKVSARE